jgi:hypothetical protein
VRRWYPLLALGLVALGGVVLYHVDPARQSYFPGCVFHWLTGWNCPGCGTTRALHQLLHGRLGAALGYNPVTPLLLPLALAWLGAWAVRAWQGRPAPSWELPPRAGWVVLGLVLAFWVLRNIPAYPFTLLAPPS